MDTRRVLETPVELEVLLKRYLRTEISTGLRIKCPEHFLYSERVKPLLRTAKGRRPWFSYDREQAVLQLFSMPSPTHDAVMKLASSFIARATLAGFIPRQLRDQITLSVGGVIMTRTQESPPGTKKIQGWTKYPDASIVFEAKVPLPMVVFEVGLSEKYEDLRNDARQWLQRSSGKVRLVVLVNLVEDTNARHALQKSPAGRKRLRKLVRNFGSDFVKAKYDIHATDGASDTSDAELYDSIWEHIMVEDWIGPVSGQLELWELKDGTPIVRESTVVLPRPDSPKNPTIRITDIIPTAYQAELEDFDPDLVYELDIDYYRELLLKAFKTHAVYRATYHLREKPNTADPPYTPSQN